MDRSVGRTTVVLLAVAAACILSACGSSISPSSVRAPVVVALTLHEHRMPSGSPITGMVTLTNTTTKTITVHACADDGWLDVGLSSPTLRYEPVDALVACPPKIHLVPGANRFPVTLSTTYQDCTPRPNRMSARQHEPRCGQAGMTTLPVGRYATRVVVTGLPRGTALPSPSEVTLLPPVGVAWSNAVLAAAALPHGTRPTSIAVPTLRSPGQSVSSHQVDVHRLYLVPGTRASLAAFLLHHLPPGASNNQGIMVQTDPVSYDAEFIPLTMPTSGPNEDQATLLYAFAADGPGVQELRIDAETASEPSRSASEMVAPTGRVVVTGYGELSLAQGPTMPVSVMLTGERARQARAAFDRLSLGGTGGCMESVSSYEIQFFDHGSLTPTSTAASVSCGDGVGVATGQRTGYSVADPHCHLLAEVVSVLPARTAKATRDTLKACRATYVG
jgi:hypothetical protein